MKPEKNVKDTIFLDRKKIRNYFYVGSMLTFLLVIFFISLNYIRSFDIEYSNKVKQISDVIINDKKILMQNSINQVVYLIDTHYKEFYYQKHKNSTLTELELNTLFKDEIKPIIREIRLVDDGYIWINEIINYEGGDNYAVRFVHPNLRDTEGSFLSTNTEDNHGNRPYQLELEGVKNSGKLFYEYYFKKLNSDKISHKMSYAKLYKKFNWVIATGVYLDDVDKFINSEKEQMHKAHDHVLLLSIIITIIGFCIALIILIIIEKQINKMITTFEKDTALYTDVILTEKKKIEETLHEIKQLKGLLPICSCCKNIRDDEGYWTQIEEYVQDHSDAEFSHSLCPICTEKLYGEEEWYKNRISKKGSES